MSEGSTNADRPDAAEGSGDDLFSKFDDLIAQREDTARRPVRRTRSAW